MLALWRTANSGIATVVAIIIPENSFLQLRPLRLRFLH
jgi:hypothetical protein